MFFLNSFTNCSLISLHVLKLVSILEVVTLVLNEIPLSDSSLTKTVIWGSLFKISSSVLVSTTSGWDVTNLYIISFAKSKSES